MPNANKVKKKSSQKREKHNFIITYDCPKDNIYTDWERSRFGHIEKNLRELGNVELFTPAPKTTIRLWPQKTVSEKAIKKAIKAAVKNGLDQIKGSAMIIERPAGTVWTWPSPKFKSGIGKVVTPWYKRS